MYEREMGFSTGGMKLKWTADVEWFEKMDVPTEEHGYYAYLYLDGNTVQSWKLTKLDMMLVFNERPNPNLSEDDRRMFRTIDKDGLSSFIADKLSNVIGEVLFRAAN